MAASGNIREDLKEENGLDKAAQVLDWKVRSSGAEKMTSECRVEIAPKAVQTRMVKIGLATRVPICYIIRCKKLGHGLMAETIIWNPIEVRNEVSALGLDVAGLIDCVRYAEREKSFVTENDAVGFGSVVVYDKAGRALREKYLGTDGWVKDDSDNQCAIKNLRTMVRVVPCNFDEFAGNRLVRPTNRSPKGEISRKKSMCNKTAWLPGVPRDESLSGGASQTWVLGMFVHEERPATAELSLPIAFSGHFFTDFGRRIMLLTEDDDGGGIGRKLEDDTVEIVDIAIRRK